MESKFRVKINRPASDLSPDEVSQAILGKNINQLVRDIQINKDGEYDHLFSDAAQRAKES